jgi:hypothetical protein
LGQSRVSIAHNTFIGENGSIEIQTVQQQVVVFSKPREDGKKVWAMSRNPLQEKQIRGSRKGLTYITRREAV